MNAATETTALDEFVALTERKRALEHDLRAVKQQLAPLEDQLLNEFSAEGVRGKRHAASGRLVSITRLVWARAKDGDKDAAADALIEAGLGDYVARSFNTHSLSAYFRDLAREQADAGRPIALDDLLPDALKSAIELTEDHRLSVRT